MIELRVTGDDVSDTFRLDSYVATNSYHDRRVLMLSLSGSRPQVAALRSIFRKGSGQYRIQVDGEKMGSDGLEYDTYVHKLPLHNAAHMVVVARVKGMVFGPRNEAVRSYLLGAHINTPIVDEWCDWVVNRLYDLGGIKQLKCYQCEAHHCLFRSRDVDEVVCDGIKKGHLDFPSKFSTSAVVAPKLAAIRASSLCV
jgi:hypothetical protein